MSLSTLSGFGGGGVGQKFKLLRNKSVSEWVSSNVDKLRIRLLRISSFIRDFLCLNCIRFALLLVLFHSKVPVSVVVCHKLDGVFSFCIYFLYFVPGLKNINLVVAVSYLPVAGDT